MTLYEIKGKLLELLVTLEETDLPDEDKQQIIADTMSGLGETEKLNGYGKIIGEFKANIETLKTEKNRIDRRIKSFESTIESLEFALLQYMDIKGTTKEKTDLFTFSIRETRSTSVVDESIVPIEYKKVKTETTIDKSAALKALKEGEVIPGLELRTTRKAGIK